MTTLADRLLPDRFRQRIQPQLPPSYARVGAPRTWTTAVCMAAIIFMARTSTPVGAAAGWRVRLRQCDQATGEGFRMGPGRMFERLQEVLLDELSIAGSWCRLAVAGQHTRPLQQPRLPRRAADKLVAISHPTRSPERGSGMFS